MLQVKIILIEFMDADPVANCPLIVIARVAPLFEEVLPSREQEDPNLPVPLAVDQPGEGTDITVLKPLFS